MKDIPGVPRPRIVEEFVASLKHGVTNTRQSVIELPQVSWVGTIMQAWS